MVVVLADEFANLFRLGFMICTLLLYSLSSLNCIQYAVCVQLGFESERIRTVDLRQVPREIIIREGRDKNRSSPIYFKSTTAITLT